MIFIFACILLLAGLILLIKVIIGWRQPRVEGRVLEIIEEENNWWSKSTSKIVTVSFEYKGEKFENKKTYLIAQEATINELVNLSLNPKNPNDFKPFYPKFELLALFIVFGIGLSLLWLCIVAIEWLE